MSRWLVLSVGLIVAAAGLSLYLGVNREQYFQKSIPVHWNASMEPDRYVDRDSLFEVFWLVPTMMAGVLALLLVLPWVSPAQFKIEPFRGIYDYIVFLVMGLFFFMHMVILTGQSRGALDTKWFFGGMFMFFGLLGNVLGKVRKNFWVGVRTPWTLASDIVWERTHRLSAWLFVAVGLGCFVAVMLGVPALWCVPVLIAAAVISVVYSLVLYKTLEKRGQLDVPELPANGITS